jgi:folate-binding protein YgfZ
MDDIPYSKIAVSGEDAFDFLQAQLAADLTGLPEGGLSAWCNPKGRVICLFRVRKTDHGFDLALPSELAEAMLKRLTMFRFRSKVAFETGPADAAQLGIDGDYDNWRLDNLRAGIPEILAAQSEEFTPHMLNLDLLGAVSVNKGCYPGQEIVARTHFRGATKRRMLRSSARS